MFQCGQHPVFSTQAVIHGKVTPQLPQPYHNYLISQLCSQDQPPITYLWNWEENDVWNVCRVCLWSSSRLARSLNKGLAADSQVTPQSSKMNLLASSAPNLAKQPPNGWLQWEAALHTVTSKLYGAQNATAQYLRSPFVKDCVFEL